MLWLCFISISQYFFRYTLLRYLCKLNILITQPSYEIIKKIRLSKSNVYLKNVSSLETNNKRLAIGNIFLVFDTSSLTITALKNVFIR